MAELLNQLNYLDKKKFLSFKCCSHSRHSASLTLGSKTFMCFYGLGDKTLYVTICIWFTMRTALILVKEDHKSKLPFLSRCQVLWHLFSERL